MKPKCGKVANASQGGSKSADVEVVLADHVEVECYRPCCYGVKEAKHKINLRGLGLS